jgi:SpoVK/Ycf46/Vps4 family AAA+-type ATPase
VGLSGEEAAGCYAKSLVRLRRIDPATVAQEKRRVISREKLLEWFDPLPGGLGAVGGLDLLKGWLTSRKSAYTAAAREYGLRAPRGALIAGIPGTGKSLTAKAIATAWQVPLLRLDLGALKSKFVGESESNLRRALAVVDAVGRCVLWCDEIEKALAGATQGAADGGVSSDALGTLLSWLQERRGESFFIATANDASILPPELMRRFDTIWFVDLPTRAERAEIVAVSLRSNGRGDSPVDCVAVADRCEGFTGAEIADLVPNAMFLAFAEDARDVTTADLLAVAAGVVPLSKTSAEKIDALRVWASGRALPATSQTTGGETVRTRALDL